MGLPEDRAAGGEKIKLGDSVFDMDGGAVGDNDELMGRPDDCDDELDVGVAVAGEKIKLGDIVVELDGGAVGDNGELVGRPEDLDDGLKVSAVE